jgi:hypothetical protein
MIKKLFVSMKTVVFSVILLLLCVGVLWRSSETAAQRANKNAPANKTTDSEVFNRFDAWLEQYLGGNSSGPESIQTGENLASARRTAFKELIRDNPRAAIERAVSQEIQSRLPASVSQFLEKSIAARGDFNVVAIDGFDSGEEYQITREVVIGDSRYKAYVYGRKSRMTTKLDIPLRGVILDDLMAVDENSIGKIGPAEFAARGVEPSKLGANHIVADAGGELRFFRNQDEFEKFVHDLEAWESRHGPIRSDLSPWTEGNKTLLFIRIDFPDRPGVPVDRFGQVLTEEFSQNLLDGPVNEFYVKNSYGKTSLITTVTPVVRMPKPQTDYPRESLFALITDARNAARAAGFETNDYDLDMAAFGQSTLLNFSGISPLANKGALINGNFTFKVITHELGHTYGLLHANLWRTTDGTPIGSGENIEYGDDFDMMGRGNTQGTHFNANYKRSLDWLTETNVQTVRNPGVYRLFAYDMETAPPQSVRAIRVERTADRFYWIEFRQLLTGLPNLMNGALIRWDYPLDITRQTQVLDMEPATSSLDDSALLVGQTFTDAAKGVKITVLGKGNTTPESLDIKVEFNFSARNGAPFDFDGDDRSDVGVFRPSDTFWYLNNSSQGFSAAQFGLPNDRIVPAKFDGDRKTDIAVYRDGTWYVQNSGGGIMAAQFGLSADIPVAADYDGDGYAELAVYRPSDGVWYMWNWVFQRFSAVQFGLAGDKPVPADYDGDGKTDLAVYRPSDGTWYLLQSTGGFAAARFGLSQDKPVAGDFDGDGRADIALYRPSDGNWYLLQSAHGFAAAHWGIATDIPAPADYDGDGKIDLAVYRPAEGVWYISQSLSSTFTSVRFGLSGDAPVSRGYNQ